MEGDNSLGTSLFISGGVEAQYVEGMEESGAGRETGDLMSGWVESQSSDVLCIKAASAIAMEDNLGEEKNISSQTMWADSQEDESGELDEMKLDMLRRMMPGFTQCFKRI